MTRPFRRRVLYIPGYDPIPPRRYRELYRREGEAQARMSGYRLDFGPRRDRTGFGWGVTGRFPEGTAQADIEVLTWADVVQDSMGRSIPATYMQLLRTIRAYVGSGALFRLMRLRRGPVIAALYPIAVLLAQLALALLAGGLAAWLVGSWPGLPVGLAVAWGVMIVGAILVFGLPNQYEAKAQVYADTQALANPLLRGIAVQPDVRAQLDIITDHIPQTRALLERRALPGGPQHP